MAEVDSQDEADGVADDADREHVYASLDQALEAHRIPTENRELVRRAMAVVGIEKYMGTATYIKAHRRHGGPVLRIQYGYTNGFTSREEALAIGEGVTPWRSSRKGLWGVTHTVNSEGGGNTGQRRPQRDYGTCPNCWTTYRVNRTCACF